ncbi:CLUMA_CG019510, isoform A [Clunio marinus]|uniref:CLUMA_CG019510, isoform A n=1 Tax=Clunio marinus TaxID=568069 RepID=A0A1J1J383_9DIPT|nr:CLUMA_CG019510, isoform A [Clunio marinus]
MVLFDKCCCFFRLTTGGMILGWLGVADSLLVIVLSIFGLANVDTIMNHIKNETESFTAQSINDTHLSIFRRNNGEMSIEDEMTIKRGMYVVLTLNLIVNCVTLISSLLLITGAIRRNSKFVLPWLLCEAACLVFSSLAAVSKSFEMLLYRESFSEGFITILGISILVGIEVYLYLCVYSLYQILKSEEKQRQLQMNEMQQNNQAAEKDPHDGLPPYSALA